MLFTNGLLSVIFQLLWAFGPSTVWRKGRRVICLFIPTLWTLATTSAWKNSVNATVGVGILIGSRALKSLNSIERIQPRMMVATFNGNPRATIISCYNPTNVSEETELIGFYDELSSLVHCILKHNVPILVETWRPKLGKNGNHKFRLHNSSNRNGQHLTDFMIQIVH